jgi:putative flippase GtrA
VTGEALRFVLVGGATTVLTYAVYLLALPHLAPLGAYGVALAAGLLFQTVTTLPFAFRTRVTKRRATRFVVFYLAYTAVSAGLLEFFVRAGVPPELAPLCVLSIVTPLQFIATRRLARDQRSS